MKHSNYKFVIKCAECDIEFGALRPHAKFCNRACRGVFNNRRASRGCELYDFVMSKRFDRYTEKECRGVIDSLASGYRESDRAFRDGRKSWLPYRDALDALGRLPGVADER
ncbi:MAG: hypothetical protein ABWY78_04975 [Microvirga sp.]